MSFGSGRYGLGDGLMTYVPGNVPLTGELTDFLRDELTQIAESLNPSDGVDFNLIQAAPTKNFRGEYRYADGTNWDPGEGEGLYLFDSTSAWVPTLSGTTPTLDTLTLRTQTTAPGTPVDGMLAFADGTSWNPGSGKGLYVYNGGWNFIA